LVLMALGCAATAPAASGKPNPPPKKCKKIPGDGLKDRYCPATIYEAADGTLADGSRIRLSGAVVTAVATSGQTAWLGVSPDDAYYSGPGYSGLQIDLTSLSPLPALAVGDRVNAYGVLSTAATGNRLAVSDLTARSSEEPVAPVEVSASTLLSPTESAPLDAVLVRVPNLALIEVTESEWTLSEGVTLGSAIIGEIPDIYGEGTTFESVTGIADTLGTGPLLLLRTISDIHLGS
jgi:hypothetical protein